MRNDRQYKKLRSVLLDKLIDVEYHFRCLECKVSLMFKTRTAAVKAYIQHGHKHATILHVLNSKCRHLKENEIDEWVTYMKEENLI